MSAVFHWGSVFLSAVAGSLLGYGIFYLAPPTRARRRRRFEAFTKMLACRRAIVDGDRLAALVYADFAITLYCNEDPQTFDEWLAEIDLEEPPVPANSDDADA